MAVRRSWGGQLSIPYTWLAPSVVAKDAKYSVVHSKTGGMQVRLIHRVNNSEKELLTSDEHDELVGLVNCVKEEHVGVPGGAFYINEFAHVLVPANGQCYFAGSYQKFLEFDFEGGKIGPRPPEGTEPGDPWPGPHVGIPYVLAAGATDIKCKVQLSATRIREEKLSRYAGKPAAARLSRRLGRVKGSQGGRIYINEAREFFAPVTSGYDVSYVYLGSLEDDVWFPAPGV